MKRLFITILLIFSHIIGQETTIKEISLSGLITDRGQEISGMDWYQDRLFLLPENLGGFLFTIPKSVISKTLEMDEPQPITPKQTKFTTPDYSSLIKGFDGFEAIAFHENKVFISIEAEYGGKMSGYLAWGKIDPNTLEIKIKKNDLKWVKTPIQLDNISYESVLVHGNDIYMIYEANGSNLQKEARQTIFSPKDGNISHIKSNNIEYRITDATKVDGHNRFWSINYFWPGDKKLLLPGKDLILSRTIEGTSHSRSDAVERLIEFEIKDNEIILSNNGPIQIVLDPDGSRNWEAIARLENEGLLIATDKYPKMILGFVPFN